MTGLKGKGLPTRKTIGAIGDIYTDTNTGKQYKCTFAYRSNNDDDFDCDWTELKGKGVAQKVEEKKEEPKPEVAKPEPPRQNEQQAPKTPNRTNYTAYSKKN